MERSPDVSHSAAAVGRPVDGLHLLRRKESRAPVLAARVGIEQPCGPGAKPRGPGMGELQVLGGGSHLVLKGSHVVLGGAIWWWWEKPCGSGMGEPRGPEGNHVVLGGNYVVLEWGVMWPWEGVMWSWE